MTETRYVAAIDQGTTSTRCMIFDHKGTVVAADQREHQQIFPQAGWVEHDAVEIWNNVRSVSAGALAAADLTPKDIAAVGITNQRETALVWERATGKPVYNAIVWQDTRTDRIVTKLGGGDATKYTAKTGLPLATYFSGPKVKWILDNVEGAQEKADAGELCFGNMDTWVLWNMTGGVDGGLHYTDPTNASRTLLMDLDTLSWDEGICADMGIPMSMLPEIRSSSEVYGNVRERGSLSGVPIAGILGDQQAATFGQACLSPGEAKNTYGTGNFVLLNTGTDKVMSKNGLLTTVCYKIGDQPTVYALEGSIAVTGSLVQWLRDNLGMISTAADIETDARSVDDNGGAYFVPAFSGLFAPHWRSDARGAIVGLTRFVNKGHLARAVLEATAYQTREVIEAMNADSGVDLEVLKVDGGMVVNELLMQFQSDILNVDVVRPVVAETTALGAAYAAGLAVGFWASEDEIRENWAEDKTWTPSMDDAERDKLYAGWKKAVTRTLDWVDAE
ncbi:glycerol kinase GlpK [Rhodococcus sp. BP-349]|uniref:glycerol kinase GlpK n=1 Tax=unclassified Rhodococcus (in: high G+C Gram-positive bacteria) TaxID=192944 RepID=UPI001C9B6F95|nr:MULTISPECIES: glycerol kinase GlpK [unclassified Rhodococcus (in: high G+C Gram-positive bacteria)]MBY6539998.1 glycerol kinase GlpK [Rhodococcus sp. BP-363]MBY6543674.1 glycerol kinase GlpK [Rhodococcus sp. BP-369]MBY6562904.1 glycerol kinase GlpK [Rhodococcus sp. BP-370]MBY6577196.1 glycerol kinase GlpK [Rhodococcus sp. BP-364]MBY6586497.1 glycerol kinase GlpK [Rhodococcus sp. BP-358]